MKTFERHIGHFCLALLLLTVAGVAKAADMTVNWSIPTTYTDGSALPSSEIAGYSVTCRFTPTGGTGGACTLSKTSLAGGAATSDTLSATIPAAGGQLCLKLSTRLRSAALSTESAEACKTFAPLDPAPPTGVRVVKVAVGVDHAPVYRIVNGNQRSDGVLGFVPVGRACTGRVAFRYRGMNFRRVEVKPGELWGTTDTRNLAAPCA